MLRSWRLLLFVAGVAIYALLLKVIGIEPLVEHLATAGWSLLPVLGVYAVAYACYTGAWLLLLADEPRRPGFLAGYAITTASFGLNYLTPIVNAGGEPYRAAATAQWLGARRATGATVLYYLLHALSSFALWFAALVVALVILPRSAWHVGGAIALGAGILALSVLVLAAHRDGVMVRLLALLHRLPLLRRVAGWLELRREALVEIDTQLREAWHRRPGRFAAAFGLECVGRAVQVLEFWVICWGVGVPISFAEAVFIGGLAALALNLFFFMPFEIGSKEGSLVGLFLLLGHPASLGMSASIVSRLRELAWIGIGLLMLWGGRRADLPNGQRPAAGPGEA